MNDEGKTSTIVTHNEHGEDDFRERIYKVIRNLKVGQIVTVLFSISVVLYLLAFFSTIDGAPSWLGIFSGSPFPAIADACLTSAIVGFTFELYVRSESERELRQVIESLLQNETVTILNGIPKVLLLRKEVQRELLRNTKLEEIVLNALQTRLADDGMGEGIYNGVILKAMAYEERWSNYRYEIFVEDITSDTVSPRVRQEFFDVIMRITYDVKLRKTRFVFTCAATVDHFNDLLRDTHYEVKWLMPQFDEFSQPGPDTFKVIQMTVDETPLPIKADTSNKSLYEIVCEDPKLHEKVGKNVRVSYTFKVKAYKIGHSISTTVVYPTSDVNIEFNFSRASIDYVDVLDYFVSAKKPSIRYIPDPIKPYKISVELKEWAFPKGGAIFVWSLKEEADMLEGLLNA